MSIKCEDTGLCEYRFLDNWYDNIVGLNIYQFYCIHCLEILQKHKK